MRQWDRSALRFRSICSASRSSVRRCWITSSCRCHRRACQPRSSSMSWPTRVIAAKRPMLWLGNGAKQAGSAAGKIARHGLRHGHQLQRPGHGAGEPSTEPRRPDRQRHADHRRLLQDGRSVPGGRLPGARPRDQRLPGEAARQPDPDRRRPAAPTAAPTRASILSVATPRRPWMPWFAGSRAN